MPFGSIRRGRGGCFLSGHETGSRRLTGIRGATWVRPTGSGAFWEIAGWAGGLLDDGLRARAFQWPPLRLAWLRCERGSVDVVCPPILPVVDSEEDRVRAVALDIHRDFCEVAIVAEGRLRSAGRIKTRPEELELFAQ